MRINIIGAGPVGSHAAYLLAKDHDVHLYEEHKEIGTPIQCTGLLTSSLTEVIKPSHEYITNITSNIEIVAPNGQILNLKAKEYLVNRTLFDQHLAKKAQDAGATIHTNTRFITKQNNSITVRNNNNPQTHKNDILIGADGANSTVAKLINKTKPKYCVGIQARVKGTFNPSTYTVYFDNNISPGFFAWTVPETKTTARVGLKGTSTHFETFLKKHNFTKLEMQAGPIPIYNPNYTTEKHNIFLIGDAATQVKATTAGGIIPGMKAAKCLAQAIKTNQNYTKLWKKTVGKDLWLHLKIRHALNKFSNNDWNTMVMLMNQKKVIGILQKYDREKPFKLLKVILKEPRLAWFARHALG
jgi:digeranylgeranylglycerophospholipid reductase